MDQFYFESGYIDDSYFVYTADAASSISINVSLSCDGTKVAGGVVKEGSGNLNLEATLSSSISRIRQGASNIDAAWTSTVTCSVVKNTFAVLDTTSSFAAVANANRGASVTLSSIVTLSLQGMRIRDNAANLSVDVLLFAFGKVTRTTTVNQITNISLTSTARRNRRSSISLSTNTTLSANVGKRIQSSQSLVATSYLAASAPKYLNRPNDALSVVGYATGITGGVSYGATGFVVEPTVDYIDWTDVKINIGFTSTSSAVTQTVFQYGNQFTIKRTRSGSVDTVYVVDTGYNLSYSTSWSGSLATAYKTLTATKSGNQVTVVFDGQTIAIVELYYSYTVPHVKENNLTWSGTFSGASLIAYASGNSSVALDTDLQSFGAIPCWLYWDGTYLHFYTTIGVDNTAGYTTWRNLHQRWIGLGITSGGTYTISMAMNNSASYNGALLTLNGVYKSSGGVVSNSIIGSTSSNTLTDYYISLHTGGPIGSSSASYDTITIDNRIYANNIIGTNNSTLLNYFDELLISRSGYSSNLISSGPYIFRDQTPVLGLYHFNQNGIDDVTIVAQAISSQSVQSTIVSTATKIVRASANLVTTTSLTAPIKRTRGTEVTFVQDISNCVTIPLRIRRSNISTSTAVTLTVPGKRNRISEATLSTTNSTLTATPYNFTKATASLATTVTLTATALRIKQLTANVFVIGSEIVAAAKTGRGLITLESTASLSGSTRKIARTGSSLTVQATQTSNVRKTALVTSTNTVTATLTFNSNGSVLRRPESNMTVATTLSCTTTNSRKRTTGATFAVQATISAQTLYSKQGKLNANLTVQATQSIQAINYRNHSANLTVTSLVNAPVVKTSRATANFPVIATEIAVGTRLTYDRMLQLLVPAENWVEYVALDNGPALVVKDENTQLYIWEEPGILIVDQELRVNMVRNLMT